MQRVPARLQVLRDSCFASSSCPSKQRSPFNVQQLFTAHMQQQLPCPIAFQTRAFVLTGTRTLAREDKVVPEDPSAHPVQDLSR